MKTILEIKNLSVSFGDNEVLHKFSLSVEKGETVGLIGETGSGKSVLIKSILGINYGAKISGELIFDNNNLLHLNAEQKRRIRRNRISYIPQNPNDALDPVYKISSQIKEISGDIDVDAVISECGEKSSVLGLYPHQLSGGRKQRILIAMAIAASPMLILADEPTTALDKPLKKKILNLLYRLKRRDASLVIVTHDFISLEYSDKIAVIYNGYLMEYGDYEVIKKPLHPYTQLLAKAATYKRAEYKISSGDIDGGCPFFNRCYLADKKCKRLPEIRRVSDRLLRCYNAA